MKSGYNLFSKFINLKKIHNFIIPIMGFLALLWFLIRVIPKPSRATYPCQRALFPIASGFIIWVTGIIVSLLFTIKSCKLIFKRLSLIIMAAFFALSIKNETGVEIKTSKNDSASIVNFKSTGNPDELIKIGFVSSKNEPLDDEVKNMIDTVIKKELGEKGLSAIIKKGDKVVIKVNLVGPQRGANGEKGRGIITDPRIVRYVAEKVRDIIGFEKPADIKVIDALIYTDKNPSLKYQETSFYNARLERPKMLGGNVYYDKDGDGILDGSSKAILVNTDAIDFNERYCTIIDEPVLGKTKIYFPNFLHTKNQAAGSDEYCDVFIGLPIFKNHAFEGITGAIKLHYGLRFFSQTSWDSGRTSHSGYGWGTGDIRLLTDYLIAEQKTRKYDLIIMDCLTGNRVGPLNLSLEDINAPTDYILTNSLICGFDPVAVDTVEAIFGGYDPDSIELLNDAAKQGLGFKNPALINLSGFDEFYRQKKLLYDKYHANNNFKSYPFLDYYGGARIKNDLTPPVVSIQDKPVLKNNHIYNFKYIIADINNGIARIELIINGKAVRYKIDKLNENFIETDLTGLSGQKINYQIAVWDKALNCSLSDTKLLDVQ